ncbi:MAG: thermonuclease family protein [Sphingomonadaceae bacterium]
MAPPPNSPARFDARWQASRRWAARWRAARWWLLLGALLAGALLLARWQGMGGDWQAQETGKFALCGQARAANCVVDGDTVMLGQRRVRLTGYDAPEMGGACEAERLLARRAQLALRDWLNRGPFELDGGADPPRDRYGRELRGARRSDAMGQEWLAEAMVEAGLARSTGWGAGEPGWCG